MVFANACDDAESKNEKIITVFSMVRTPERSILETLWCRARIAQRFLAFILPII